jgi:hypothetical protein
MRNWVNNSNLNLLKSSFDQYSNILLSFKSRRYISFKFFIRLEFVWTQQFKFKFNVLLVQ